MVFYSRDQVVDNTHFHLASRGGLTCKHPGNKASRELIRRYAPMYVATKKTERGAIARQIYQTHFHQQQRIFVIEREYFLRCIQWNRNAFQQRDPDHPRRRKLSNERVESVTEANGGCLTNILALPRRVFIPTGETFAIDIVDHILRDEAKKFRHRSSTSSWSAAGCNNQEHGKELLYSGSSSSDLGVYSADHERHAFDQAIRKSSVLPCCVESGATTRQCPATPRSSSNVAAGTIVSVSSMDVSDRATPPPQFSSHPAMVSTQRRPIMDPEHNHAAAVQSIHSRKKNFSAVARQHHPEILSAVTAGLGGLDSGCNFQQDLNLWKTYAEHMTENINDEDLLSPISSFVLDNMWRSSEQEEEEDHGASLSIGEEFLFFCSDDDSDDLDSLIETITK